jgi:hypothetical protein
LHLACDSCHRLFPNKGPNDWLQVVVEGGRVRHVCSWECREKLVPHERRPTTRAGCASVPRPCPYVSCRYNLYLDVHPETGAIQLNFPDLRPWEMPHSCALDVAERGAIPVERVGDVMNLTRERARQLYRVALSKVAPGMRRFVDEDDEDEDRSEAEVLELPAELGLATFDLVEGR